LRLNRVTLAGALLPVLAFGVAACGSDNKSSSSGSTASGTTLTIYSSLPLQGTSRGQSTAVINGEKLALDEVNNKVGKFAIKYVSLDDSTAQNPGTADEGKTGQNARQAVRDKSTIF
jgi:branched-chain amino acid transport system substrate-binding protein